MRDATIARSYAEALLELGERHGERDAFTAALAELAALLESTPRARNFIETPLLDVNQKKEALRAALGGRVPPLFLNFVFVVLEKRRQRLLADIAREYVKLLDERLGRLHVDVTLAREIDEAAEREIAERLSASLHMQVVPHVHVNPDILGGVVVRYGDRVFDGSVRRRLMALRRRLLTADSLEAAGAV